MSLLIVSLLVAGASLVAIKVYFQHKEKEAIENKDREKTTENVIETPIKTNEQIVAERLEEIAEFEKEVDVVKEHKKEIETPTSITNNPKNKPNYKKTYKPKKQQPKIKAK